MEETINPEPHIQRNNPSVIMGQSRHIRVRKFVVSRPTIKRTAKEISLNIQETIKEGTIDHQEEERMH